MSHQPQIEIFSPAAPIVDQNYRIFTLQQRCCKIARTLLKGASLWQFKTTCRLLSWADT